MQPRKRITWHDLPRHLQGWAEEVLGGPVVRVVHAEGGYSPGTTDALFTAGGRSGFLKAVHPSINPDSPTLLRAERRVLAHLPPDAAVARMIDSFDEGSDGWIAVLLAHVPGQQPPLPWSSTSIARVLAQLEVFAAGVTPAPVPDLARASTALAALCSFWPELAAVEDLDPWLAARVERLHEVAQWALTQVDGDTLVHLDLRADNLLVGSDGSLVIIDWPWAVRGARWVEQALLLIEFISSGDSSVDPDHWIGQLARTHRIEPLTVVGLLVGVLSYFEAGGRQPDPPGLPTLRAFQRFQADALRGWLRASVHARDLQR